MAFLCDMRLHLTHGPKCFGLVCEDEVRAIEKEGERERIRSETSTHDCTHAALKWSNTDTMNWRECEPAHWSSTMYCTRIVNSHSQIDRTNEIMKIAEDPTACARTNLFCLCSRFFFFAAPTLASIHKSCATDILSISKTTDKNTHIRCVSSSPENDLLLARWLSDDCDAKWQMLPKIIYTHNASTVECLCDVTSNVDLIIFIFVQSDFVRSRLRFCEYAS